MPADLKEYRPSSLALLIPGMHTLHPDEKCWSLYERDEITADFKQVRRMQTVRVIRGGRLVEFSVDLGPASAFTAAAFTIASMLEDSVGEVRDIAEYMRSDHQADLQRVMDDQRDEGPSIVDRAIESAAQMQTYMRRNPRHIRNLRLQKPKDRKHPLIHALSPVGRPSKNVQG